MTVISTISYNDDTAILAGYHVTEVKDASISSLDCGKGTNQWNEIIVQLLDGSGGSTRGHMKASTFIGIMNNALHSTAHEGDAKLFFEFRVLNGVLQKLRVISVRQTPTEIKVDLQNERVVCKPFERAKAGIAEDSAGSSCCGNAKVDLVETTDSGHSKCCGNESGQLQDKVCCG